MSSSSAGAEAPRLRVLHVIDSLRTGGAEALLIEAARGAADRGVEIEVVTLAARDDAPFERSLRDLGVVVHIESGRGPKPLFDPIRFVRLVRLVRRVRPDVVHTHLAVSNVLGTIAARWAGVPSVTTIHNVQSARGRRARLLDWIELRVLARGRGPIIAVGRRVGALAAQRWPRRRVEVVENPAPSLEPSTDAGAAVRRELLGDREASLLLAIGRLDEQKGFDVLLEAVARLGADQPDVVVAIAGDGGLDAELRRQTLDLGIDGRVRFLGSRSDVADLFAAADVCVVPSRWEGLPLVVLEAMTAGVPIVASDVGDVADAVGGDGWLVPPCDPETLARSLVTVLSEPKRAREMAARGRERVAARYSREIWSAKHDAIYESVAFGPTRVAIVAHGYYPRIGGIERLRAAVTPRLRDFDIEPSVVCRRDPGTVPFEVLGGVPVHRKRAPGPRPVASLVFTIAATIEVIRERPHVVLADQFLSTSRVALLGARLVGAQLIVVAHRSGPIGDVQRYGARRSSARRVRSIAQRARFLVGVSDEVCSELEGMNPRGEVRLIRNGIDTERFAPVDPTVRTRLRSALAIADDRVVFVFVGRFAPEKRACDLLDAWRAIGSSRRSRSTLLFVGDGSDPPTVEPADGDVRILGAVDDVAPILAAADVFVLPSTAEGLSVAAGEAAASGLDLILTDVGAARDLVTPGRSGQLVPPLDPAALAEALQTSFDDPDRRRVRGEAARANIVAVLGIERTVVEYAKTIQAARGASRTGTSRG
jgi:glycosyltransferase involved in cell wall biosynthesis